MTYYVDGSRFTRWSIFACYAICSFDPCALERMISVDSAKKKKRKKKASFLTLLTFYCSPRTHYDEYALSI